MTLGIKVAILEDHQSIIDGYIMRLRDDTDIEVAGIAGNVEELEEILHEKPEIDVLIMDVSVPASADDTTPIPILRFVPRILSGRQKLRILVVSMLTQHRFVKALTDAGVSGYIFKHDSLSIRKLPSIIKNVHAGRQYYSEGALDMVQQKTPNDRYGLTSRQLEILSLCASYPDLSADQLALRLGIAGSTLRNLLSEAYERLDVHTKAAAIDRARAHGLIP